MCTEVIDSWLIEILTLKFDLFQKILNFETLYMLKPRVSHPVLFFSKYYGMVYNHCNSYFCGTLVASADIKRDMKTKNGENSIFE